MVNRKVIFKTAWIGGLIFWMIGVIGNHGLGKIKVQTPAVIVGEVGFVSCWVIGLGTGLVTTIQHRPAYRRLKARRKRKVDAANSRLRSFRLAPRGWPRE